MKQLMLLAVVFFAVSCANPEDRATGNPDSTSFNKSGNEKNLNNSNDDPEAINDVGQPDTSSSPATMKENANNKKDGTNRGYKAGGDSTKQ